MDKNKRTQREERRHQEDMALNKGLLWVVGAVILLALLLVVNKYMFRYNTSTVGKALFVQSVLQVLQYVSLAAAVIGAVWLGIRIKKTGGTGVAAPALLIGSAAVCVCCFVCLYYRAAGAQMLFLLVPAWGALAMVYYLYQREFFYSGVCSGLGTVGLWMIRSGVLPTVTYVYVGVVLLLLVLWLLVLAQVKKGDGALRVGGREFRLLPRETSYALMRVTSVVNMVMLVLALALGGAVAYYLIYLMVAWLFALLVYYTVKMM